MLAGRCSARLWPWCPTPRSTHRSTATAATSGARPTRRRTHALGLRVTVARRPTSSLAATHACHGQPWEGPWDGCTSVQKSSPLGRRTG
eukprot:15477833-Alexandrium_andersonii.AAC.1